MINPTMSQSPCLVYLHQSRVIHLIFKHLCRSCRSAPGVEGTNKLTSSLMGVIKCFYTTKSSADECRKFTEMDTCFWESLLFRLFVGFGWIEKKIKNIWDIFDHVISMLTRILRLTRTFEKVKWNAVAYFAHLATSAVSACGLSLSLIKRNIHFT